MKPSTCSFPSALCCCSAGNRKGEGGEKEKGEDADGGDDLVVVAPRMFKHLVGQGHVEFSSGRQQDAAEYMQHLLEVTFIIPEGLFLYP